MKLIALNCCIWVCCLIGMSLAVEWQSGDWAMNCDFNGKDLQGVNSRGEDCGGKCYANPQCTHFTWTDYNGGTCWMKTGGAQKSEAFFKSGAVCGITRGSSGGPNPTPKPNPDQPPKGGDVQITVINNCPYTVWPGFDGFQRNDPNWRLPMNGGWELGSGQRTNINLPASTHSVRIWARTNCRTENGQFRCETGDCGPWVQCSHDGKHRGGEPPATLAEFTLNGHGDQDYYDISLVDGYNIHVTMGPKNPNQQRPGQFWCKHPQCKTNLNAVCPEQLKKYNSNRNVVGCSSACTKFNTDDYCCRGAFKTPDTCKSTNWAKLFKDACPTAYSFAYDDGTSTYFCRETGYDITFC